MKKYSETIFHPHSLLKEERKTISLKKKNVFLSRAINLCFVFKKISFFWFIASNGTTKFERSDGRMGGDKTTIAIQRHRLFPFNLKEFLNSTKISKKNILFVDFLNNSQTKKKAFFLLDLPEKTEREKYEIVKIITVIVWEKIEMVSKVKDDDENDSNKTHITN